MHQTTRVRLLALFVLIAVLAGLFIAYGAELNQSNTPPYGTEDVVTAPSTVVGERVSTGGTVVETDPLTINVDHDGETTELVLRNPPDAATGDFLTVVGELTAARTLTVRPEPTVVRAPWEVQYMYAISLLGAGLLGLRAVNEWRLDRDELTVEPRAQTLYAQHRERNDA